MILLYFLVVFVFFFAIMQWYFRWTDACAKTPRNNDTASFLSTEQPPNSH